MAVMSRNLSSSLVLNQNLLISDGTYSKASSAASPFILKLKGAVSPSNSIRATAGDGRENLHYLQRANRHHLYPSRRALVPSAPSGRLVGPISDGKDGAADDGTMEKMMEEPFTFTNGGSGNHRRGRTPWEIKEGESEYKMRYDMPGMTKADVKLCVEDNTLIVKAEKEPKKKEEAEAEEEEEEDEWSAKSYRRYYSRIVLPENVIVDKIKAEVKDGILYMTMPKAVTSSKILDIHVP